MSANHTLLPVASRRDVTRVVRGLLRQHIVLAIAALAALVGGNIAALIGPAALGRIVDRVVEGDGEHTLLAPTIVLVVAALASSVAVSLGSALVAQLGESMLAKLREDVVAKALDAPADLIEAAGTGDLISRVSDDVSTVSTTARHALPAVLGAALTVGLTVVGLGVLDWRFAAAALCAAPVQALALRWYLRTSGPVYTTERVKVGELTQVLLESTDGRETIRAFGMQPARLTLTEEASAATVGIGLRAASMQTWFFGWLNLAEFIGMASVLTAGYFLVREDLVTVGAATAAGLYFHRLFDPINTLLGTFDDVQASVPALGRLVGVLQTAPPTTSHGREPASAAIELRGVSHAYEPGHDVLHDIDLRVESGELVALVGESGAGKTTIAKLVAGIVPPTSGTVALGGVPIEALDRATVQREVGLVSQEVHVFAGTLRDDLRLARADATDVELLAALEAVGTDILHQLPDGLDSEVGAGGLPLTAIQAQQIALARLLLADRPAVILDEATAEAGSGGARLLETAATRVLEGRTGIVIAHRLAQARLADRIVLLEAGRVVEEGTHADLVAAGGAYARLWRAWAADRE